MNLTEYINKTSKFKLSKPQMNLIVKLDGMGISFHPTSTVITNPTNGITAIVDPMIASLVNWVYVVHRSYRSGPMNYHGTKVAIGTFDRVRYLILDLDKQTFRDFID